MRTVAERTLRNLQRSYIQIVLADLLDDVDCSPSTWHERVTSLEHIGRYVPSKTLLQWTRAALKQARKVGHYCSGAPLPDEFMKGGPL